MDVPTRDVVATSMVAAAAVAYALWEADAVVPGFDELLRGSRAYLLGSAAVGLLALGGGVWALLGPSASGLRLLMGATGVLWLTATARHLSLARNGAGAVSAHAQPRGHTEVDEELRRSR